ncbi:hypothetical protein T439DRAFT_325106 [Meredithblackwellia eburnea MCA 4105]
MQQISRHFSIKSAPTLSHPRDRNRTSAHGSSSAPPPSSTPPDHDSPDVSAASQSSSPPPPNKMEPGPSEAAPPTATELILSPVSSAFPPPLFDPPSAVPFSTQAFVRNIEQRSGETISRNVATTLMEATREMLKKEEIRVVSQSWRRGDLENEAYLYQAALNELKSASQIKSRADSTVLRSMTASLQRETDALEQRQKEEFHRLKSDIQLDMNTRKEEVNTDLKGLDRSIMELNSKFTILLGEARTEIETVKWVSTRRVMTTLVILAVGVVGTISNYSRLTSPSTSVEGTKEDLLHPNSTPVSIEQLGIVRAREGEADADVSATGAGWFGWSSQGRVEGEADGGGSGSGSEQAKAQ